MTASWSYSALNGLLRVCSLQFYYEQILALEPDRISPRSTLGTCVHHAHAYMCSRRKQGQVVQLQEVIEVFDASWGDLIADPRHVFLGEQTADSLGAQGRQLVELLVEQSSRTEIEILDVEREFEIEIELRNGEKRLLRGVLDLVVRDPDGVTVVDLKTSSSAYAPARVEADLQATIYCLAARILHGSDVSFRFDVLVKTKTPKLVSYYAYRDERDFERLVSFIEAAERLIDADAFVPNEGCFACRDCGFQKQCLEWGRRRRLPLARPSSNPAPKSELPKRTA